jgi:predicted HicB family RNase H-like nuclease
MTESLITDFHDSDEEMETIQIDLPDKVLLQICLMAHEANMTLNDFIIQVLREHLERLGVSE